MCLYLYLNSNNIPCSHLYKLTYAKSHFHNQGEYQTRKIRNCLTLLQQQLAQQPEPLSFLSRNQQWSVSLRKKYLLEKSN